MRVLALFTLAMFVSVTGANSQALDPLVEYRLVGAPMRSDSGTLIRSAAAVRAFRKQWVCPSTGQKTGACPGWSVDHVIPISCGGADAVYNMQWLPNEIKSAAVIGKDRFERQIYTNPLAEKGCK